MLNSYYSFGTSSYAVSYLNFLSYPATLKLSISSIPNSRAYHPFKSILILNGTNFFYCYTIFTNRSGVEPRNLVKVFIKLFGESYKYFKAISITLLSEFIGSITTPLLIQQTF